MLLILLCAAAVALGIGPRESVVGQLARIDTLLFDAFNRLSPHEAPPDIAVIEIDADSVAQIGRWPWPRGVHAAMLQRLTHAKVRAIGFDVLFSEPDLADPVLAKALREGPPSVLAVGSHISASGRAWPLSPVWQIAQSASALGHAHFRIDADGVVRGLYLEESGLPAFSLALLNTVAPDRLAANARRALEQASVERRNQSFAAGAWPASEFMLLPGSRPVMLRASYAQILRGELDLSVFEDRIVLIGATAEGLGDLYAQRAIDGPAVRPGVDLHATALATLLLNRPLARAPSLLQAGFAVFVLALTMALLYRSGPGYGLLIVIPAIVLTLATSAGLLAGAGLWMPPAGALAALALAYPLWSWRRLEAAMAGLVIQARALRDEPDLLPSPPTPRQPLEPVSRELQALDGAADRIRTLRRLLFTVIDRLPNPAIVTTGDGRVLLSNRIARTMFSSVPIERQSIAPWLRTEFADDPDLHELPGRDEAARQGIEASDRSGRSWLVDIDRAREHSLPLIWLLQFTDITPIRNAQRARDEMMRFLSHDMRAPLVSVLSLTDLARKRHEAEKLCDEIDRLTRNTLELADGFVQWARAENRPFDPQPLDLLAVLTEAADSNWALARQYHATIRVHSDPLDEAPMRGDAGLIRRAIGNLIENALKYGPKHGIVDVSIERRVGGKWRVSVADTGPGLGVQDPQTLFEPYTRGGDTRGRVGSGLGLALVRTVAERHGGSVLARDCAPVGAEFHLDLPAAI